MKVLLFEPSMAGHRAVYAAQIIRSASELPVDIVFATTDRAVATEEYRLNLPALADRFELDSEYPWRAASPREVPRQSLGQLREAIQRHRPDHVYLPWGNGIGQLTGLLAGRLRKEWPAGTQVETIFHRTRQSYPPASLKERVMRFADYASLSRTPFAVHHYVDLLEYEWWSKQGDRRSRLLPDPVDADPSITKHEARERLGLPIEGRYFGAVGLIAENKGTFDAIRALASGAMGDDVRLLLMGKQKEDVQRCLEGEHRGLVENGRVQSVNRYVDLDELKLGLAALDLTFIRYESHIGISSVVLRSAAAHRPVLVGPFKWAKRVVPQFGLGWVSACSPTDRFEDALASAIDKSENWTPTHLTKQLGRFHESRNFGANLLKGLRERLGIAQPEDLIDWDHLKAGST